MSNPNQETELSLYAHLSDPASLNEADHIEDHIQLESKLISGARIRVRKITPVKGGPEGGTVRYVMAIKTPSEPVGGVASVIETPVDVTPEFYQAFAAVAHRAIVKRRYTFMGSVPRITGAENVALPAVKYEVDQFAIPSTGKRSEWIKLDIELDDVIKALTDAGIDLAGIRQRFDLTKLPFSTSSMFTAATATPEQKATLGRLWETEFAQKLAPDVFTETGASEQPSPVQQTNDQQKVNADASAQESQEGPTDNQ